MLNINYREAESIAKQIKEFFNEEIPTTAVILGSGLGSFTEKVTVTKSLPYAKIEGFPQSTVVGHKGCFSIASTEKTKILVLEGRFHYYEGIPIQTLTLPIAVLHALNVKNIVVSNAAGGINKNFTIGDLMIIDDQINLTGNNPLIGHNDANIGPRFVDMSEPYSHKLIELAKIKADELGIKPQQGTYLSVSGPTYETKAEIKAFAALGADAVGMSTAYEVILANYFNINVLGISCITNMATGIAKTKHEHNEVVNAANSVADTFGNWVKSIIDSI